MAQTRELLHKKRLKLLRNTTRRHRNLAATPCVLSVSGIPNKVELELQQLHTSVARLAKLVLVLITRSEN